MHDTDQMLINEINKLERAIAAREAALGALERAQPEKRLPKRYVLDLEWAADDMLPKANSFVVAGDCKVFECQAVTHTMMAIGTTDLSEGSLGTIAPQFVDSTLPFLWRASDASRGRQWQNAWLPWTLLGGGNLQPRWLPAAGKLGPGAEIAFEAKPVRNLGTPAASVTPFSAVTYYRLQVAFIGVEVLP